MTIDNDLLHAEQDNVELVNEIARNYFKKRYQSSFWHV